MEEVMTPSIAPTIFHRLWEILWKKGETSRGKTLGRKIRRSAFSTRFPENCAFPGGFSAGTDGGKRVVFRRNGRFSLLLSAGSAGGNTQDRDPAKSIREPNGRLPHIFHAPYYVCFYCGCCFYLCTYLSFYRKIQNRERRKRKKRSGRHKTDTGYGQKDEIRVKREERKEKGKDYGIQF